MPAPQSNPSDTPDIPHASANLGALLAEAARRAPAASLPARPAFTQRYHHCETHGAFKANLIDAEGVERGVPDVCTKCSRQNRAQALFTRADVGKRFLKCSFDNYKAENDGQRTALAACRGFANNFEQHLAAGSCMILRGNPGTGKNHLAAAIMVSIMEAGFSALRVKAAAYLDEFWSKDFGARERWLSELGSVDLLVVDEIGRTSNGKSAGDAFFRLFDVRYEAEKPTIIISNLAKDELKATVDAAAYDRLTQGGGKLLNFDWASQRNSL